MQTPWPICSVPTSERSDAAEPHITVRRPKQLGIPKQACRYAAIGQNLNTEAMDLGCAAGAPVRRGGFSLKILTIWRFAAAMSNAISQPE